MPVKKRRQEIGSARWMLYILRCSDSSLYTGITRDLAHRVHLHNTKRGARYTMTRGPVTVVFQHVFASHAAAARAEVFIKRSRKIHRERLVAEGWGYFEKNGEYFDSRRKKNLKWIALGR